jgi:NlpC/P60 family putative phage cell wall peptidase
MSNKKINIEPAQIINLSREWLGTPYIHQASLKGIGCDCLGLIRGIWRELYGVEPEKIPNYTPTWSEVNGKETLLLAADRHCVRIKKSKMQIGDILLFRMRKNSPAKHMGILSQDNYFIHAYEGNNVVESPLNPFWYKAIVACFRFPNVRTFHNDTQRKKNGN